MPPKEAAPVEPTPDELIDALAETRDGEYVVADLLEEWIALAQEEVRRKHIQEATVAHTAEGIIGDLTTMLSMHFADFDPGEPDVASSVRWAPDNEQRPAEIDAWSRGAVPARKKSEMKPPQTPVGSAVGAALALGETRGGGTSLPPRSPRAQTRDDAVPAAAPAVFIAKAPGGGAPVKKKKEAALVTDDERRAARLRKERQEEEERMARIKAELKGREYIYDSKGGVIPLEQVLPDKLPAFQQMPRVALGEPKPPGGKVLPDKGGGKAGRKGGGKLKIDFGKNTGFTELDSLQPPLMESMVVREGVKLTEGDAVKGGDPRSPNPERMSRKEFEDKVMGGGDVTSKKPMADSAAQSADATNPPSPPAEAVPSMPKGAAAEGGQDPALRPVAMPPADRSKGEGAEPRNNITRERGGTAVKARLPPPMLPATVGFGLELPYTGSQSQPESPETSKQSPRKIGFSPPRPIPPASMKTANPTLLKSVTG